MTCTAWKDSRLTADLLPATNYSPAVEAAEGRREHGEGARVELARLLGRAAESDERRVGVAAVAEEAGAALVRVRVRVGVS